MFWFNSSSRFAKLESRVEQLEKQSALFILTLQNIQISLTNAATNTTGVAEDVREIQDLINSILQQAEHASALHGYDPGDGYEH